jgi:cytochrome b561
VPWQWADRETSYGWVSIWLHWLTAGAIVILLFVGNSIDVIGDSMLRLHTTIGVAAYPLIVARLIWRRKRGYVRQRTASGVSHGLLAKLLHTVLLIAMAVMLVSGPLTAWSGGKQIRLGQTLLPAVSLPADWFAPLLTIHAFAATVLTWGVLVHILAVLKHSVWNKDGTFGRMMTPHRIRSVAEAVQHDSLGQNPQ